MVCGTVLLIVAAVVVALRERLQPVPSPEVPEAQALAEVRVKAVERNSAANVATAAPDVSRAVAIICGKDSATADRLGCNKKDLEEGLEVFAEYEHKRHHIYARIPKSDRWDAESGWVSPSADILCGTFEDIKNTLKTRGEKKCYLLSNGTYRGI